MIGWKQVLWLLGILMVGMPVWGQTEPELIKEVGEMLSRAKAENADVLAPKSYEEALKLYRQSQEKYTSGQGNLSEIRKNLSAARLYLEKSSRVIKVAEVAIGGPIKARSDAIAAGAPDFSPELWREAEEKFNEATRRLEDDKNLNDVKKRAEEAEKKYRDAELEAIKANYLNETRDLLEKARRDDVRDRAPKTYQRAQELAAQAEKELEENRYDKDLARSLARQANYEVKHAIYLAGRIREMKKNKESEEDLLLAGEAPLADIAGTIDAIAQFDAGYDPVRGEIQDYIRTKQDQVEKMSQELAVKESQIRDYQARISELEEQLGGIAARQSELQKRIEAQEKIRRQFAEVEGVFDREEALVSRQGDAITIRLVGLNFASGRAEIRPDYFPLLTKVQKAISVFPGSRVRIEGHTDSYGSDQGNLNLSQDRAAAVRQYLLANMSSLEVSQTEAVGYGESKPIANNETPEGRTKNRRIDIVIEPNLPTAP